MYFLLIFLIKNSESFWHLSVTTLIPMTISFVVPFVFARQIISVRNVIVMFTRLC